MGRPKDKNSRRSKAERRRLEKALSQRVEPAEYILQRRALFSFVTPTKGPDGRVGEIDQDVCDPIGQLHAVGLLDGHGHDPQELRDKGRFWGQHLVRLMKVVGVKMGAYERSSRSIPSSALTGADLLFDRMDRNLEHYERRVLFDLIVEPLIGHHEGCLWAEALVTSELWARGKVPPVTMFKTAYHDELLNAAIRGLCQLIDASLADRRMAA